MMTEPGKQLFKKVRYFAAGKLDPAIKDKLVKGKAKAESYLSALATHVIGSDPTHHEIEAALDVWQIPAVTPTWVEFSVRCNKLLPTDGFLCSSNQLFSKCVVCCSGLPKQDKHKIWALVTYYGGKCQADLTKECTHLVLSKPEGKKYEEALKHEDFLACVAPDWILDSVKEKKLPDVCKYHPKLNIVPQPVTVKETKVETETVDQSVKKVEAMSMENESSDTSVPRSKPAEVGSATPTAPNKNSTSSPATAYTQVTEAPLQNVQPTSTAATMTKRPQIGTPVSKPKQQTQDLTLAAQNQLIMQQVRYGVPHSQANHPPSSGPPRFYAPSHQMRSPAPPPRQPMMMSSSSVAQVLPPHQAMMTSQQAMMTSSHMAMQSMPQQQASLPGNQAQNQQQQPYMLMSPSPKSTSGSPRRSSGGQGGGKKKKSVAQPARMSPHAVRQVHPMSSPYQSKTPPFSPQQQQQMMRARMPGGMEQTGMLPTQKIGEIAPGKVPMVAGSRPGLMPGQYPTSPMMSPGDSYQNMQQHQHQMMQIQMQQQQMQRINMLQQTSPSGQPSPQTAMNPMQQAWPRASSDGSYPDPHQGMYASKQHAAGYPQNQMIHQQPQMQGQPQVSPHQTYNSMMMAAQRMPGQPSPQQQQQYMFQQRSPGPGSRYPTTSTLEAAGMGGISPIALQQALLNSPHQDQPALIHPSLQGPLFSKESTSQQSGGSASKKRSKPRKKPEGGDEEGKPRARSRSKTKKAPAAPPSTYEPAAMVTNKPVASQVNASVASQMPFAPQGSVVRFAAPNNAHYQAQMVQTPFSALHQNPPASAMRGNPPGVSTTQQSAPLPIATSKLSVTGKFAGNAAKQPPKSVVSEMANNRGVVIDPLLLSIKEMEGVYQVRDPAEGVTQDLFLLGCIFCICEYQNLVHNQSVIELWKKMIHKYGGAVEDTLTPSCTHLICASRTTNSFRQAVAEQKRCVTVYWLNDVLHIRNLRPPWLAIHLPTVFSCKEKPATNHILSYTGFHTKERERLKMMAFVCGARFTGHFSRTNTVLICKRSKSLKFEKAREWMVPCVTLRWIRDVLQSSASERIDLTAPTYQAFDDDRETANSMLLDYNKSVGLLEPWKTPIPVSQEALFKARVKRKHDTVPQSPSLPKCPRIGGPYKVLPRVCFTGFAAAAIQEMSKKLEALDCRVETTLALCTHLVAKQISRTVKFLTCISSCSYIVTPGWIDESFKYNVLLEEEKFHLHDKAFETKFNFSLSETLKRAKQKPLFQDCLFAITSKVTPDRQTLRQIIECAGGRVLGKMPPVSVLKHLKEKAACHERIFILSCPDDDTVYLPLKKEGLRVHNAELVLTGVLKQEINSDLYRL